ncbi:hypothetical protein HanPI659440_Chr09g0323311 [Helianthus annuus]|nr:hypothetical protein HanPI659440_Chr09g0323311 [Helianthus annuus]
MSTGEHQEDLAEEMSTALPPLKWSRASFDGLIRNLKFPGNWGALYPEEGQTAADAPAGVFHQMHCTQGFYSFVQRASAKKILQQPPKSFHDWKQKFFFIKAGIIPVWMVLRGKEDVPIETLQTPVDENWYQDLKDVPNIALPEKALVGAGMSLNWKMERDDKPVYTEDGRGKIGREGGRMGTIKKKPDEELWYHRIVGNFVCPRDADLSAQPTAGVSC